jgi:hypothetical protein
MAEPVRPKNVLDDVTRRMRYLRYRPLRFFANPAHKVFFWLSVLAMGGVVLCVLFFNFVTQWRGLATLTRLLVVVYYISATLGMVFATIPSFRLFLSPEKSLLGPVIGVFDQELGLITRVAYTYERRDLEYALDRATLMVTQLRSRIALLIGALDKVGVVPLLIGAYFSVRQLLRDQPLTSSELSWMIGLGVGLGIMYAGGIGLLGWAQYLDHVCLVLKHAVQAKQAGDLTPEACQTGEAITPVAAEAYEVVEGEE